MDVGRMEDSSVSHPASPSHHTSHPYESLFLSPNMHQVACLCAHEPIICTRVPLLSSPINLQLLPRNSPLPFSHPEQQLHAHIYTHTHPHTDTYPHTSLTHSLTHSPTDALHSMALTISSPSEPLIVTGEKEQQEERQPSTKHETCRINPVAG
jgi:hypothetical protein